MRDHFPPEIYIPAMIIVWGTLISIWIYERRQARKAPPSEQD